MAESKRSVAELVVQGPAGQSLRQQLVEGQVMRLGRAPASGWAVSWDRTISREHADLCWKNGKLTVTCLPTAANPIRLRGMPLREIVVAGMESFEIGQTSFYVEVTYVHTTTAVKPTESESTKPHTRMPLPTARNAPVTKVSPLPKQEMETKDVADVLEDIS